MNPNIVRALIITTIAGISTTLGSLLGLIFKKGSPKFMSFVLGFTAGVMVGISFLELFPVALKELGLTKSGIAFLIGFIVIFIFDYFIPHDYMGDKEHLGGKINKKLLRTGIFIAMGRGVKFRTRL